MNKLPVPLTVAQNTCQIASSHVLSKTKTIFNKQFSIEIFSMRFSIGNFLCNSRLATFNVQFLIGNFLYAISQSVIFLHNFAIGNFLIQFSIGNCFLKVNRNCNNSSARRIFAISYFFRQLSISNFDTFNVQSELDWQLFSICNSQSVIFLCNCRLATFYSQSKIP